MATRPTRNYDEVLAHVLAILDEITSGWDVGSISPDTRLGDLREGEHDLSLGLLSFEDLLHRGRCLRAGVGNLSPLSRGVLGAPVAPEVPHHDSEPAGRRPSRRRWPLNRPQPRFLHQVIGLVVGRHE